MDTWYETKAYFTVAEIMNYYCINSNRLSRLMILYNMEAKTWKYAPSAHLAWYDVRIIAYHVKKYS